MDELRTLYQDVILRHGRRPIHGARLACYDVSAEGENPTCGDKAHVFAKLGDGGVLDDIGFEAKGCAISIASADLMAECLIGADAATATRISAALDAMLHGDATKEVPEALRALSGVSEYPSRIKCATLPWRALMQALATGRETVDG